MHHFEGTVVRCRWCQYPYGSTDLCSYCNGTSFMLARITLACRHEVWMKPDAQGSFRPSETKFSFDGVLVKPGAGGDLVCIYCSKRESSSP